MDWKTIVERNIFLKYGNFSKQIVKLLLIKSRMSILLLFKLKADISLDLRLILVGNLSNLLRQYAMPSKFLIANRKSTVDNIAYVVGDFW